jgi:hypothetical protein
MYLAQWFSAIVPRDSGVPRALVKCAAGICIGRQSNYEINTIIMKT